MEAYYQELGVSPRASEMKEFVAQQAAAFAFYQKPPAKQLAPPPPEAGAAAYQAWLDFYARGRPATVANRVASASVPKRAAFRSPAPIVAKKPAARRSTQREESDDDDEEPLDEQAANLLQAELQHNVNFTVLSPTAVAKQLCDAMSANRNVAKLAGAYVERYGDGRKPRGRSNSAKADFIVSLLRA